MVNKAVSKTVTVIGLGGSNPSPDAKQNPLASGTGVGLAKPDDDDSTSSEGTKICLGSIMELSCVANARTGDRYPVQAPIFKKLCIV